MSEIANNNDNESLFTVVCHKIFWSVLCVTLVAYVILQLKANQNDGLQLLFVTLLRMLE